MERGGGLFGGGGGVGKTAEMGDIVLGFEGGGERVCGFGFERGVGRGELRFDVFRIGGREGKWGGVGGC